MARSRASRRSRHRDALCAGRRHSGRILEPSARGRDTADTVGDSVHRPAARYRGEFLARAGAASRGARHQEPGAGRRCAAFCLRRARLGRRHHRACAIGVWLCLGRRRRRHRGGGGDLGVGIAAGAFHRRNPARPRPRRRVGKSHGGDPGRARRGRCRTAARPHGRSDAFHRRHRAGAAHLSDRPRRGDQAKGAGCGHTSARRRRSDLHRRADRARQ